MMLMRARAACGEKSYENAGDAALACGAGL